MATNEPHEMVTCTGHGPSMQSAFTRIMDGLRIQHMRSKNRDGSMAGSCAGESNPYTPWRSLMDGNGDFYSFSYFGCVQRRTGRSDSLLYFGFYLFIIFALRYRQFFLLMLLLSLLLSLLSFRLDCCFFSPTLGLALGTVFFFFMF
ncbi:MAG: hypothetical protein BYD32DRAFT_411794 [Podila humilis]|nr:MAG: hypothetical protein BYD32DRAFT_411794 [Podila humilis]